MFKRRWFYTNKWRWIWKKSSYQLCDPSETHFFRFFFWIFGALRIFHCITKFENIFNEIKLICVVDGTWARLWVFKMKWVFDFNIQKSQQINSSNFVNIACVLFSHTYTERGLNSNVYCGLMHSLRLWLWLWWFSDSWTPM